MKAIIKDTGRKIWCRCGQPCNSPTLHEVLVYEEDGVAKLALRCHACRTTTLMDVAYPTPETAPN